MSVSRQKQKWWWCWLCPVTVVFLTLVGPSAAEKVYPSPNAKENEASFWNDLARKELDEALHRPQLTNVAKNIIFFLGDGMGITAETAGRILKGQKKGFSGEEGYLVWERFPNLGLMKTYNLNKQVPDSAGTATAYLTGVKANYQTLGVTGNVELNNCIASLEPANRLSSILQWAQDADKETGVITTTQITHATPAALYAKSASRKWQCDSKIIDAGHEAMACKDIARQLIEDEPGRNIKVIMGGGRNEMGDPKVYDEDPEEGCARTDGRNLPKEWKEDKSAMGKSHAYVTSTRELREIDVEDTEFIMGLFSDSHQPYEVDRDTGLDGSPKLKEMVEVAIDRLKESDEGFFLLVEGGRIDHGLHHGQPRRALEELLALDEAVEAALGMIDLEETLVIVTADHSHVMTVNGYPQRGNNILGVTEYDHVTDHLPYTTLMFTNGHGYNYSWNGDEVLRRNLTGVDTTDKDFEPLAAVPTEEGSETHGGEDVGAYAMGPMAHLFHRVHEQNYIAHVMAYAACIGPYEDCDRRVQRPMNEYTHVRDRPKSVEYNSDSGSSVVSFSYAILVAMAFLNAFTYFS